MLPSMSGPLMFGDPNLGIFKWGILNFVLGEPMFKSGVFTSHLGAFRSNFGKFKFGASIPPSGRLPERSNLGILNFPEGAFISMLGALRSMLGLLRSKLGTLRSGRLIPPPSLGPETLKSGDLKSGPSNLGPESPKSGIFIFGIFNLNDGLSKSASGISNPALGPLRLTFGIFKSRSGPPMLPSMSGPLMLGNPNFGIFKWGILNFALGEPMFTSGVFTSNLGALRSNLGMSKFGASTPPFGSVPERSNLGILNFPEGAFISMLGPLRSMLGLLRSSLGISRSGVFIPPPSLGHETLKSGDLKLKSGLSNFGAERPKSGIFKFGFLKLNDGLS